ncbi:hypothetical protein F4X33_03545 [Candidatus Poribacteria bacterium]|nr:hypothetical protein [Candidatus Poribacteria bacterium]
MSIDADRKKLLQEQRLDEIRREPGPHDLITVHKPINDGTPIDHFIYCVLIPKDLANKILCETNFSDDPEIHTGETPDAIDYGIQNNKRQIKYFRYGDYAHEIGAEPLIISRYFGGIKTPYDEISEGFRHFHNLFHNRETDEYINIDDAGNEERIAIVKPDKVKIRLKEIRQFLAVKEMYLSILFEFNEYSAYSLQELGLNQKDPEFDRDSLMCWRYDRLDTNHRPGFRSESRLRGRKLIKPLEKSKSSFGAYAEEPKYVEFIIDVDENGDEINYTCDPAKLDHYSNNPGAPSDLTPVHFRKNVLDKYYNESSKYTVEDSMLKCAALWSMTIDNHSPNRVIVLLGDFHSLPYTEQQHWLAHNIPPEGSVSPTFWRRNFKGEWVSSDQPEHLFKDRYDYLQRESEKHLSWQLLRPLAPRDEHHLKDLRIPSTDEQGDFDALVLSLTKVLIDSLNQKEIKKLISLEQERNLTPDQKKNLNGIGWLEITLNSCGVAGAAYHIAFLRKLQRLRSAGSAHRKGRNYQKIAEDFNLESQSLREVFAGILSKALEVVDYFIFLIRSRQINREIIEQNSRDRGYEIIGQMIGIADSGSTDGSVNHDEVIYELDSKPSSHMSVSIYGKSEK